MTSDYKRNSEEFPNPETPIPAWPHYEIVKFAESEIQRHFKEIEFQGYLISLGVAYTVYEGDETQTWYKMDFGPSIEAWPKKSQFTIPNPATPDNYEMKDDAEQEVHSITFSDPFEEEFMLQLYEDIYALVMANITHNSDVDMAFRAAAVNKEGNVSSYAISCRYCTMHSAHRNTGKKYWHQWSGSSWRCIGSLCSC